MHKKESLKRITLRTELVPVRSSTKSLVTRNPLNDRASEEILFDGGLKLTLNPEMGSKESLNSMGSDLGVVYEPGKKRRNRSVLPPLLKKMESGNREEIK